MVHNKNAWHGRCCWNKSGIRLQKGGFYLILFSCVDLLFLFVWTIIPEKLCKDSPGNVYEIWSRNILHCMSGKIRWYSKSGPAEGTFVMCYITAFNVCLGCPLQTYKKPPYAMKTWKNLKKSSAWNWLLWPTKSPQAKIEWGPLYCTSLTIVKVTHIPVHIPLVSSYKLHYT